MALLELCFDNARYLQQQQSTKRQRKRQMMVGCECEAKAASSPLRMPGSAALNHQPPPRPLDATGGRGERERECETARRATRSRGSEGRLCRADRFSSFRAKDCGDLTFFERRFHPGHSAKGREEGKGGFLDCARRKGGAGCGHVAHACVCLSACLPGCHSA